MQFLKLFLDFILSRREPPLPPAAPSTPLPTIDAPVSAKEPSMNLAITSDYVAVSDTRNLLPTELDIWTRRWPDIMPWEIDTRDFSLRMATKALDAWQAMRDEFGAALYITSACRNWAHNTAVDGKQDSDHLTEDEHGNPRNSTAFDIAITGRLMGEKLERLAIKHGFNAIGRYPVSKFIHVSMRTPKPSGEIYQWGRWYTPKVRHV